MRHRRTASCSVIVANCDRDLVRRAAPLSPSARHGKGAEPPLVTLQDSPQSQYRREEAGPRASQVRRLASAVIGPLSARAAYDGGPAMPDVSSRA